MAAVAVAGVASAQTITGEYGFGWASDKAASKSANGAPVAATTKSGLLQTDGSITISATEDLGGGMTLAGSTTVDLKGRSSVNAENATLSVSGGFGTLVLGSVEFGNGILGLGGAGTAGRGLDNGVALDGGTNADYLQFKTPALVEGLTAKITRGEVGPGAGDGPAQVTGLGVDYSAGPLTVAADTTSYTYGAAKAVTATSAVCAATDGSIGTAAAYGTDCGTDLRMLAAGNAAVSADAALAAQKDSRIRLSFAYDLGVAKAGYGYQKIGYKGTGKDNTQTVMGLNVPVGAMSIGLAMSTNQTDGGVKTKGRDFSINYALSKRTSLNLSSMNVKKAGSDADTYTRLRLKTTF